MTVNEIKQRFGIIGNSPLLEIAIKTAMQVAPTDITVLIHGESGVGKEAFPQIIHQLSSRKHGTYIAVNCGAIPEGTIDSELFGHEKGSFTGAHEARKGYFEVANGGTIFLDEVADLPLATQVRLLRVLESGEFFKVGSSKALKTDVRVVAATNINILESIHNGKFREDLYYRLSTVPINIPPLRNRKEDIYLLFRKFSADFGDKYRMPPLELTTEAKEVLTNYFWPGNIRQLKNVTEQLSILEKERLVIPKTIEKYLPQESNNTLPVLFNSGTKGNDGMSERDLLYKVLFDMKRDVNELRAMVLEMSGARYGEFAPFESTTPDFIKKQKEDFLTINPKPIPLEAPVSSKEIAINKEIPKKNDGKQEEVLLNGKVQTLQDKSAEYIRSILAKNKGAKKLTANELGISERTLYRYISDYGMEDLTATRKNKKK
jgi:transcriptional regulator with PAS, ATPase and Fis domain